MVTFDCKWSDPGSWSAFHDITGQDEHGNGLVGDVLCQDVEGCYLHSNSRLIAAIDLKDTVIVETSYAIWAADNAHISELKKLIGTLSAQGRSEVEVHPTVYRRGEVSSRSP